jgi:peptidoglycan hydrolase FlgJ
VLPDGLRHSAFIGNRIMQISNSFDVDRMLPIDQASDNKLTDVARSIEAKEKQADEPSELREAFNNFVGQTLFGQMLKSMRSSVGKPAYIHGGRTEEIFQAQLDNIITEDLTKSSASSYADPMFQLFQLNRQ